VNPLSDFNTVFFLIVEIAAMSFNAKTFPSFIFDRKIIFLVKLPSTLFKVILLPSVPAIIYPIFMKPRVNGSIKIKVMGEVSFNTKDEISM